MLFGVPADCTARLCCNSKDLLGCSGARYPIAHGLGSIVAFLLPASSSCSALASQSCVDVHMCECIIITSLHLASPATTSCQHAPAGCTGGRPPDRLGRPWGCCSSGTKRGDVAGERSSAGNHTRCTFRPRIIFKCQRGFCRHPYQCLCMHAVLQALARMHGPRSEACVGPQSLQQFFASSTSHAAKRNEADDQAQPAGGVDSAQAAAGQQQAAGDGAEQSANGAPQEPPTVEGLQAELNTQREASEGHAAEVSMQPSSCVSGTAIRTHMAKYMLDRCRQCRDALHG